MPTASQYDRLCQLSAAPNDSPRGTQHAVFLVKAAQYRSRRDPISILRYIPEAYGSFFDVDESRSSHSGGG